LLSPSMYKVMD